MPRLALIIVFLIGLVAVAVAPSQATFRGENGLLVYQAQVGRYPQLFTIRPDGSHVRQITRFANSGATNADWSADGKRIVFTRHWQPEGGPKERFQLDTVNADGSALHALTKPGFHLDPGWFPDGKRIIFLQGEPNRFAIVNADGTGLRDAGIPGHGGDSVCVFGDGKRIAFLRARYVGGDNPRAIFVARLDRPSVRRITAWEGIADKIDCSPDGSRVVFSTPEFGEPGYPSSNVYTVRTDGTGLKQLTHDEGGKVNNGADSWSPDGKKIAFVSNRGGQYQIYVMNVDGTEVTQLTRNTEAHLAAWGTHP